MLTVEQRQHHPVPVLKNGKWSYQGSSFEDNEAGRTALVAAMAKGTVPACEFTAPGAVDEQGVTLTREQWARLILDTQYYISYVLSHSPRRNPGLCPDCGRPSSVLNHWSPPDEPEETPGTSRCTECHRKRLLAAIKRVGVTARFIYRSSCNGALLSSPVGELQERGITYGSYRALGDTEEVKTGHKNLCLWSNILRIV